MPPLWTPVASRINLLGISLTTHRRRALAFAFVLPVLLSTAVATSANAVPVNSFAVPGVSTQTSPGNSHPGLDRLRATGTPNGRAIVTFSAVPQASQVAALKALGLTVQPMNKLPLALVSGPTSALPRIVSSGIGLDVYPDESLQLLDTESSNSTSSTPAAAQTLRDEKLIGTGVTVGIVDSGCDATQPDLAKRVTHNVKLVSPEYANLGTQPTIVVPTDMGPYSNTDIAGGHGTHVAGIVAADSSSIADGSRLGVAPGANLACFAIGEGLFTTAVVTAYDYILSQPDMLGIKVINNSWGNSYRQFDPSDPVAVATKAVYTKGVTVVFAAGNSGSNDVQASLNPFSQSPWVISVAAATIDRQRADFSSNGFAFDNSQALPISASGHSTFLGDKQGLVHPDVTAPGVNISSTCNPTGSVIGQCAPGENTSASGTSMASPAIAGTVAVLLQAQPRLTPDEVREALQATATPVTGADSAGAALPFWEVGYGYINLDKAVALVQGVDFRKHLIAASTIADKRVMDADGAVIERTDLFSYAAPTVTVGTDDRTFPLPVGKNVNFLTIVAAHPSAGTVGIAGFKYTVKIIDPTGKVVATGISDPKAGSGTAVTSIDLAASNLGSGDYRFQVVGDYAVSDPDTIDSDSVLGRQITVQVAQLDKHAA